MKFAGLGLLLCSILGAAAASCPSLGLNFEYTDEFIQIGKHKYHYLKTEPANGTTYAGTVLLLHGFPDSPFGWQKQIPLFSGKGYRVIAPSQLGYYPSSIPDDLEEYSLANMAGDMAELVRRVTNCGEKIILGAHDVGLMVGWPFVARHPELVKAIIGLTERFAGPPPPEYIDLADIIAANPELPSYPLKLRDPAFPDKVAGETAVRGVLRTSLDALTAEGESAVTKDGLVLDLIDDVLPSPYLTQDLEDLYVERATSHDGTLRGPMRWYQTARMNWEDERAWNASGGSFFIEQPTLFFCGQRDIFTPCERTKGMDPFFANLTRGDLDTASHWPQLAAEEEVNQAIESFLSGI